MEGGGVIDYLTFIEELKEIKTSLGPNTDNATMSLINKKQKKYENMVNEFEKEYAPKDDEPIDHEQRMKENMQIEGVINGMVKSVSA